MNPIQQAIAAMEAAHIVSGQQAIDEALNALRSLQKEVDGVLPEPYGFLHDASGNDPLTFKRGPITEAYALTCSTMPIYTADQLRTAVAAALGRGAVPSGWKLAPVEPTPEMRKAAADAWLDCDSKLFLNKAGAAVRAAIAISKESA